MRSLPHDFDAGLIAAAIDAANNAVVIADLQREDQPLIYVNRGFEELTGYSADDAVGRNCRFLQYRADGTRDVQGAVGEIAAAVQGERELRGVIVRNYRADGSLFYNELFLTPIHDRDGVATHMVGVQNDVTERVRAQKAMTSQLDRVQGIMDALPIPLGMLEVRDGDLAHLVGNEASAEVFGLSERTADGLDGLGFVGRAAEAWVDAAERATETGRPVVFEAPRADAREFEITLSALPPEPGGRRRFVYVAADVGQGRRLTAALFDAGTRERFRVAADLHDSVGQALVGASMMAQALDRDIRAAEHGDARIDADTERLRALLDRAVQGIRSVTAGIDPFDTSGADLGAALERLCADIGALFEVECSFEAATDAAYGDADAVHLYRIAREAVSNAIRHGHASRIRMRIGGATRLSIEDDGTGMTPGDIAASDGIGVAAMRLRARQIGARLEITPLPGGGTRVAVVDARDD